MSLKHTLRLLTDRAGEIRQQDGTKGLLKALVRYSLSPVYKSESFWLVVDKSRTEYKTNASGPRIDETRLDFKVVTSNQEADLLEAEGFGFRRHHTYFNYDLKVYTHWLACGAVACCTFVDKEFAAVHWLILSQQTQDALKEIPLRVDYAHQEAFGRGIWVNPKFRGMQVHTYTARKRDGFLLQRGIPIKRSAVDFTNRSGRGIGTAGGSRLYGIGRRTRVLGRTFWREHHFEAPIEWSETDKIKSVWK